MKDKIQLNYRYDGTSVTVNINPGATLDELVPLIEGFLRACTYVFDGHLEIVKEKK